MQCLPDKIKFPYAAFLIKQHIPEFLFTAYLTCLQHYLDFCHAHSLHAGLRSTLLPFLSSLKNVTDEETKQARHTITLLYELVNSLKSDISQNPREISSIPKNHPGPTAPDKTAIWQHEFHGLHLFW